MNPKLQRIQHIIRCSGLLTIVEKVRYLVSVVQYHQRGNLFKIRYPDFKLPPEALAYDAYSAPDWDFYMKSGLNTAKSLASIAINNLGDNPKRALEWGCGLARVIRHLPSVWGAETKVYGSDYNVDSIRWCKENISEVNFVQNGLHPPLPFDSDYFDLVYSISVFTHLSESVSHEWMGELNRITRPNGILIISTNGDSRVGVMLPKEAKIYESTGIVIRDKFEEGKKMFFACHSPNYLRTKLFKGFEVIEHVPEGFPNTGQDLWVLRKP